MNQVKLIDEIKFLKMEVKKTSVMIENNIEKQKVTKMNIQAILEESNNQIFDLKAHRTSDTMMGLIGAIPIISFTSKSIVSIIINSIRNRQNRLSNKEIEETLER